MRQVPFRHLGGYAMLPGILGWLRLPKEKPKVVLVVSIEPEKDDEAKSMRLVVEDGVGNMTEIAGNLVSRLTTMKPNTGEMPERFREHYQRLVGLATFTVGDEIAFRDEGWVRQITGDTETLVYGTLIMLGEHDSLLVSYTARIDGVPKLFVLEASPEEVGVITKRIPIGESLVIQGTGTASVRDVYNPEWIKAEEEQN